MSTTIIDKLFAVGEAVTGKAYRMIAAQRNRDGTTSPLQTDNYGSLNVAFGNLTGTKDIFARLRTSQPFALFDGKQVLDNAPLVFTEELTSGGTVTHLPNEASSLLTVTGTSGSKVIRQSRAYMPYQPGRCQYILATGTLHAAVANVRKRIGYFDANNGIYLEQTSAGLRLAIRSFTSGSAVNTEVEQANWNLDKADGTGPSGFTLDATKFLIFFIEFGWLGGAGVRCGVFFSGEPVYLHSFDFTANLTPFMTTPSLPIRYEIESTAASAGATFTMTCCAAFSEGGFNPTGVVASVPTTTTRGVSTTLLPVISVRLKTAYQRAMLIPMIASAQVTSVDDIICQVIVRGSLTGASWNDTSSNATEYDVSATAITGGIVIASFFGNDNASDVAVRLDSALVIAANLAGATDIISLVIRTDSGSANVLGSLTWKEVY